ncbi:MAG TPA: acyl-CoA dehydrogenase family protein [Jatrophihabitantaceae bacterium]|jgi:acyl-CoA dehydrogenase
MAWGFETDAEYADKLEWARTFMKEQVERLDVVIDTPYDLKDPLRAELIPPLQDEVKKHGLWACHLSPELGGQGFGQLKLALLNAIVGRSDCGPTVFGSQPPDSGNSEIIAAYGTAEQKSRYLGPLLANQIVSCFSMTEPQGGADPGVFTTRATFDGDHWILNGHKWFTSNARFASFFIVVAVTEPPDVPVQSRISLFLIPADIRGIEFVRNVGRADRPLGDGTHGYLHYNGVQLPPEALLGERGRGFEVAQARLNGGRLHHAMRTVGKAERVFEMLCERGVSRVTRGEQLANKQTVQEMIADSWLELEQFRLLVLRTAWKADKYGYAQLRGDIAGVKAMTPTVLRNITSRAIQLHGSLGVTNELPLFAYLLDGFAMGMADGPTEVHKATLARQLLRKTAPAEGMFPTEHIPTQLDELADDVPAVATHLGRMR